MLDALTLMAAVQAVDAELRRISEACDAAEGETQADLQELLLSYSLAAKDLKEAYLEASKGASNLPPYANLVLTDDWPGNEGE